MKKELFKTIISDILSDDFFSGYKFIRSENTLILRNGEESTSVELDHWRDYEDDSCVIRPIYGRHFNIIARWFEKFCVRKLQYQRLDSHVMLDNESFGHENEISLKYDFSDYDDKFPQLLSLLKNIVSIMYEEYATLNDYYNKIVVPRINGEKELPDLGIDWAFRYLTSGYLVDRDNYPALKAKILERVEWMHGRHEPNVEYYYDRMDEIISYMENNVKL